MRLIKKITPRKTQLYNFRRIMHSHFHLLINYQTYTKNIIDDK